MEDLPADAYNPRMDTYSQAQRIPPTNVAVAQCEDPEAAVFMQAFDERGMPWANLAPVAARIETNRGARGIEVWLAASFTWLHEGPSPQIAQIKVSGWSSDHDYLVTPADPDTHCYGPGAAVNVKIPTRILG